MVIALLAERMSTMDIFLGVGGGDKERPMHKADNFTPP
jgi:hypothetical protein